MSESAKQPLFWGGLFVAGILSQFLGTSAHAESDFMATGLNVANFDIDGVKLYMSPTQVEAALRARFGKNIKFETQSSMSYFATRIFFRDFLTRQTPVQRVAGAAKVLTSVFISVPKSPRPMVEQSM